MVIPFSTIPLAGNNLFSEKMSLFLSLQGQYGLDVSSANVTTFRSYRAGVFG